MAEIERIRDRLGSEACLLVILSDHLKRQWTRIRWEEIGALTAAAIISDVYWHDRHEMK